MIEPQGQEELARVYGPRFFARRYKLNWRAQAVIGALWEVFHLPARSKVIDLGCATGDLVAEWRKWGFEAYGIEGSRGAEPYLESRYVYFFDLTEPLRPAMEKEAVGVHMLNKFALATCFEVFEHIDQKYADQLVDNICQFSDHVVISAAGPGQEGHHHVNCRPKDYWIEKFSLCGYSREYTRECQLRYMWSKWKNKRGIQAYYHNLLVFERR
jgi:hypothetical protein